MLCLHIIWALDISYFIIYYFLRITLSFAVFTAPTGLRQPFYLFWGPRRSFGELGRMDIYFQGAGEH